MSLLGDMESVPLVFTVRGAQADTKLVVFNKEYVKTNPNYGGAAKAHLFVDSMSILQCSNNTRRSSSRAWTLWINISS